MGTLNSMVESLANRLAGRAAGAQGRGGRQTCGAPLREMLERPFSPDRKLVLTVIDREPTRELVRQLLLDAVLEFGRRASAPVAGMARGPGLAGEDRGRAGEGAQRQAWARWWAR